VIRLSAQISSARPLLASSNSPEKNFLLQCSGKSGVSMTPKLPIRWNPSCEHKTCPPKSNQYMNVEGFAPFNPPGNYRLSQNAPRMVKSTPSMRATCSLQHLLDSLGFLLTPPQDDKGMRLRWLPVSLFPAKPAPRTCSAMPCQASSAPTRLFPSALTQANHPPLFLT